MADFAENVADGLSVRLPIADMLDEMGFEADVPAAAAVLCEISPWLFIQRSTSVRVEGDTVTITHDPVLPFSGLPRYSDPPA